MVEVEEDLKDAKGSASSGSPFVNVTVARTAAPVVFDCAQSSVRNDAEHCHLRVRRDVLVRAVQAVAQRDGEERGGGAQTEGSGCPVISGRQQKKGGSSRDSTLGACAADCTVTSCSA